MPVFDSPKNVVGLGAERNRISATKNPEFNARKDSYEANISLMRTSLFSMQMTPLHHDVSPVPKGPGGGMPWSHEQVELPQPNSFNHNAVALGYSYGSGLGGSNSNPKPSYYGTNEYTQREHLFSYVNHWSGERQHQCRHHA